MCILVYLLFVVFFFQAEDGIRDLVRSRGLGDVYKRQDEDAFEYIQNYLGTIRRHFSASEGCEEILYDIEAVSYTHLTLPTSDLV